MPKPPKKLRLSVYLDPAVMKRLSEYAARRDQPRSLIAETAIESFLSPDTAERQEAVLTKRLDQLDRRVARMERDVGISVEMLAVFVRFWVATTPALPEPAAQAARAKTNERYDQFVTALGRRCGRRSPRMSPAHRTRPDRLSTMIWRRGSPSPGAWPGEF